MRIPSAWMALLLISPYVHLAKSKSAPKRLKAASKAPGKTRAGAAARKAAEMYRELGGAPFRLETTAQRLAEGVPGGGGGGGGGGSWDYYGDSPKPDGLPAESASPGDGGADAGTGAGAGGSREAPLEKAYVNLQHIKSSEEEEAAEETAGPGAAFKVFDQFAKDFGIKIQPNPLQLSSAERQEIRNQFTYALKNHSMEEMLYVLTRFELFKRPGEIELKHGLANGFLAAMNDKQVGDSKPKDGSFYFAFRNALNYQIYFAEFSLMLMFIVANINDSLVRRLVFYEKSKDGYFIQQALATRNLSVLEGLEPFLAGFYKKDSCIVGKIVEALDGCTPQQLQDYFIFVFPKKEHKKYPAYYFALRKAKNFKHPDVQKLVDPEYLGAEEQDPTKRCYL